jgi:hypothetical protein
MTIRILAVVFGGGAEGGGGRSHNSPLNASPDGRSSDGSNVRPKNGRNSSPIADCNSRSDIIPLWDASLAQGDHPRIFHECTNPAPAIRAFVVLFVDGFYPS